MLETKRHDKTKLSVLEHQTWWERSSKERNARNKKTRQDEAQRTRTSNVVGEELKRKKRSKQKDTTRRSSAYSNIKRGGRGAQKKETLETKRHDKTKVSILEHQTWWEKSSKKKKKKEMLETKTTRQDEAQRTRTSNVVGEELKTKRRRCPEERKIKRFQPSWPNGEYIWISSETRKELISRPKDNDEILLIRIARCKSIIPHTRRPYDYDAILLIRIIRCKSIIRHTRRPYDYDAILLIRIIRYKNIIRHTKIPKKTHTPRGEQKKD